MKLPNGHGSVYKVKAKLRKPYKVVVTKGFVMKDGRAVQKRVTLGYTATKEDGLNLLAQYNGNPYDINRITFSEVAEKWKEEHYKTISTKSIRNYENAYRYLLPLHNKEFRKLKVVDLEGIFLQDIPVSVQRIIKILLNHIFRYALRYEYTDKNYAEIMKPPKPAPAKIVRTPFSEDEIKTLWKHTDDKTVRTILCDIYSGFRPSEMLSVKIDKENMLFIGGMKTASGKNRAVPIHNRLKDILDIERLDYTNYRKKFNSVMEQLNMKHYPHDCRVTFATRGDGLIDEYMLKILLGHKVDDMTHRIYIKKPIDEFRKEINKLW